MLYGYDRMLCTGLRRKAAYLPRSRRTQDTFEQSGLRQALNLRLAASCFGLNLSGKGETADVAALAAAVTVAGLLTFLSVSRRGHRVDDDLR